MENFSIIKTFFVLFSELAFKGILKKICNLSITDITASMKSLWMPQDWNFSKIWQNSVHKAPTVKVPP